jgi:hypothetical protein
MSLPAGTTLQDAISEIAALLRAVSGIRAAPEYPSDQINAFPTVIIRAWSGSYEAEPFGGAGGAKKGLHDVAVEVHVARKGAPYDVKLAMRYSDTVPAALLADPTLGGKADTFARIRYTFGDLEKYTGTPTVGWLFIVEGIKQEVDL